MHCPFSQVKLPTKQPVSFKRLLYDFPLVLHVKLSFVMVQFWEPRAKDENKASELADVFLDTSLICHERLAPSYSIMLVLTPRSCTEPSLFLFLVKNNPHMEVQESEIQPFFMYFAGRNVSRLIHILKYSEPKN